MLILSRTENERIIIGDDIEIVVIEIRRGVTRLGIEAPRCISVHRKEVYEEITGKRFSPSEPDEKT